MNRTDPDVATVVTEGLSNLGMPPFKLQQQELGDLIAYIRTLRLPRRGDLVPVEVTVETTDGKKLRGTSVNRSFADMQLRTPDRRMHLLRKEGARYREVNSQVDWTSYDGQLAGNRFSAITAIDKGNVARFTPKWIYSLPDVPTLETTPLVVEGVMYVTSANECYALDAGSVREVWHYHRPRTKGMGGKVNRGAAISGNRVFLATDNAHLLALNRATGELIWESDNKQYVALASSSNILVFGLME